MPLARGLLLALGAIACAPDDRHGVENRCPPPPDVGQAQWQEVHHGAGSFGLPSRYEYDTTAIVPGEDYVEVRYNAGPDRMRLTHGGYGVSIKPGYGAIGYSICRATIGGRRAVVVMMGHNSLADSADPRVPVSWLVTANWGRVDGGRPLHLGVRVWDSTRVSEALAIAYSVRLPSKWHDVEE